MSSELCDSDGDDGVGVKGSGDGGSRGRGGRGLSRGVSVSASASASAVGAHISSVLTSVRGSVESIATGGRYGGENEKDLGADMSVGKGQSALCFDPLHDDNLLDTDAEVAAFIDGVMPPHLFQDSLSLYDTLHTLLRLHPYFNMFYTASLQTNRVTRWTLLVLSVLISIFIDTLFFSTFFPDGGECQLYTTEVECIEPINSALSTPLCMWEVDIDVEAGGSCLLTPPPEDMTFVMILVLLTVIIAVPLSIMAEYFVVMYGVRRPAFERWGCTLGRTTQSTAEISKDFLQSSLVKLRVKLDNERRGEEVGSGEGAGDA
ncbi:hypothetical protein B484DRAFT_229477 [Ochromonadaceae sp. CCMP2298]|nr:hypothetical protein B484DRAFT_229477 [Ochromonadaceae sp. CCMP2298]